MTLRLALVAALLLLGVGFSAAPAFAQDNYGAIALSDRTGNSGASWDYPNRFAAERSALESCGARDCEVVIWFSNSCGALAQADDGASGWASAYIRSAAENQALRNCPSSCWISQTVCTTR